MLRITIGLTAMLFIGAIAAMPLAAATDTPAAQTPTSAKPDDGKIYGCIEGMEQILPGEYYACRAKYHFQREHYRSAVDSLEESAYWANKDAQYSLGLMYFNGDTPDIPANRPLGIAWLALAAERKNPAYMQMYAIARAQSSPEEIKTAGQLWQKMRLKYGDKVAGLRALRRFNHEIKPLEDAANSGGILYLNGYSPYPETASAIVNNLHAQADKVFDGLVGTVTVGSLQTK